MLYWGPGKGISWNFTDVDAQLHSSWLGGGNLRGPLQGKIWETIYLLSRNSSHFIFYPFTLDVWTIEVDPCPITHIVHEPRFAKDRLANMWLKMFPQRAYDLLLKGRLPAGARLVSVSSDITTPTCKEFWRVTYAWRCLVLKIYILTNWTSSVFLPQMAGDQSELLLALSFMWALPWQGLPRFHLTNHTYYHTSTDHISYLYFCLFPPIKVRSHPQPLAFARFHLDSTSPMLWSA